MVKNGHLNLNNVATNMILSQKKKKITLIKSFKITVLVKLNVVFP